MDDPQLDLAGRRFLVTGASLGIGAAVARLFARRGARLVLHHASAADAALGQPDAGAALERELSAAGADVRRIDRGLDAAAAGGEVAAAALKAFAGLDGIVLCASVQARQPLAGIGGDALAAQLRINFTAQVELLQAVVPALAAQGWGRVISIGSVNQVRPHAELMVYAALKAALHNFIVGIARQNAEHGVTANTVSPGLVATPRNAWRRADAAAWSRIEDAANPMGRAGAPEEVAQCAGLLAGEAGAFITGADIPVDGGARL